MIESGAKRFGHDLSVLSRVSHACVTVWVTAM
jgi:hypothetical protein